MSDLTSYFNGEWIPDNQIKIDPDDMGFVVGDVVFSTLRTFNGKQFAWKEHIDRLYRSLKYVRNDCGLTPDEFMEICHEAVRRNEDRRAEVGDFNLWPFITRGPSKDGPANVYLRVKPIAFAKFVPWFDEGAHGIIVKSRSYSAMSLDPKAKHHSRLNMVLGEMEARDVDPDGLPIFMDLDGNITEGSSFNVMLVKDGVIKTPTDSAILQGISRGVVMGLAEQLGIPVVEEDLRPYDMYTADEVFFTRTTPCIVPCSKVDNRPIGDEFPGPIMSQLMAAYSERVGLDIVDQAKHFAGLQR